MHWDILDEDRKKILPLLSNLQKEFGADFYLAGGTGLALQIGHRDSIDFDFFTKNEFDTLTLFKQILSSFSDSSHMIIKTQEEKYTLSILINNAIKISFMRYEYELLRPIVQSEFFPIASLEDIGCMKLSAITSRSVEKDYVDLYFILQKMSLRDLLALSVVKFPSIDTNLILKSIVYFEDIISEPILYKEGHDTDFSIVKNFLVEKVRG